MLLNAAVHYGIIILTDLKGKTEPLPAYSIVKRHSISASFVDQLCRKLRDAGYIRSNRGPSGGYTLIKEDVSLLELVDLFSAWKSDKSFDATDPIINQVKSALADITIV